MREKKKSLDFQALENRLCMTVVAGVSDAGALRVTGQSDGDIAIIATEDAGTFTVADDGNKIGTFEDVSSIRVAIDGETDMENKVSIQLNDQSIDEVFAAMGNGMNQLEVDGEQQIGRIFVIGGDGNDDIQIDVATEDLLWARLHEGDDSLNVNASGNRLVARGGVGNDVIETGAASEFNRVRIGLGQGNDQATLSGNVAENLFLRGGLGDDQVQLHEESAVGNNAFIRLGDGANSLAVSGAVENNLNVRSGFGADTVELTATATVGARTRMVLGNGDNSIFVNSTHSDGIYLQGFAGDDTVNVGDQANISGNLRTVLGQGENAFDHSGFIDGNLVVVSANADDVFEVDGFVSGNTILLPGVQGDD